MIRSVADEDDDAPPGYEPRIPPRWIACLVALKHLQETSCAEMLLGKLQSADASIRLPVFAQTLHIFHYLIEIAPLLPRSLKEEAVRQTELLLADSGLGEDWGSGIQASISIRWNLDITAAYLLGLLGGDDSAMRILDAYRNDNRIYARNMARIVRDRLTEAKKSNTSGKVKQA